MIINTVIKRAGGGPVQTQTKTATPNTTRQNITPDDGYYLSEVIVEPVTNEVDSNILPNNIRQGVSILGVEGNLAADKPDQTKTVTPTTSQQVVTADTGYELASVTIEPVQTQTKTATANGEVIADAGSFLSSVTVAIPEYKGEVEDVAV